MKVSVVSVVVVEVEVAEKAAARKFAEAGVAERMVSEEGMLMLKRRMSSSDGSTSLQRGHLLLLASHCEIQDLWKR